MPITPFHSVPKGRFRRRLIAPTAAAFVVGVVVMGAYADPDIFRPQPVENAAGIYREIPASVTALSRGGINHWRTILYFGTHVPEVCWGDNAVNDFQQRQCSEFWERLGMGALLGLLPFGAAWLMWFVGLSSLNQVYRRARKRLEANQPLGTGIVTDPAEAPADWFSRIYCLRVISVAVGGDKQIRVYVPLDAALPVPGAKMVLFEPVSFMGEARHFGLPYAPHVVVFGGVRKS